MLFSKSLLFSIAGAAIAAPASAATLGSKKNVYLATCTTRGLTDGCIIPLLCTAAETQAVAADTSSAVIYYNGAATAGKSPTDVSTVNSPAKSWEGATRKTSLSAGDFQSKIQKGSDDLKKSQIAGTATLGTEDMVCFRDGESTFQFNEGLLGLLSRTNCVADYWCASIE